MIELKSCPEHLRGPRKWRPLRFRCEWSSFCSQEGVYGKGAGVILGSIECCEHKLGDVAEGKSPPLTHEQLEGTS